MDRPARDACAMNVGLLVPLHRSAGMFGPSCELCAELAVEEINAAGGILDREVRIRVIDGSPAPRQVADEVDRLVSDGDIDAVVGWQLSSVRQAVAPRIAARVPYVYTALYEGGEHTPGVFLVGETPGRQLLPAMRWLRQERGVRRWFIVGNDYVWPRRTAAVARHFATLADGEVTGEVFVPLGTERFDGVVRRIRSARADGLIMLLVGADSVQFNRAFARAGLDAGCIRLSTLLDENVLLATGAESTHGIWAAAAYFETLVTPESLDFGARYAARFGADAPPLNSIGESCYEGLLLLAALARRARSLEVEAMCAVGDSVAYEGPRGAVHLRDAHAEQRIYLADAEELQFRVITQL
jgi:ABC-type branched-subunit amino acid transport system substrate-binding protein